MAGLVRIFDLGLECVQTDTFVVDGDALILVVVDVSFDPVSLLEGIVLLNGELVLLDAVVLGLLVNLRETPNFLTKLFAPLPKYDIVFP